MSPTLAPVILIADAQGTIYGNGGKRTGAGADAAVGQGPPYAGLVAGGRDAAVANHSP